MHITGRGWFGMLKWQHFRSPDGNVPALVVAS
jgi:hypothetical protein